MGIRLTHVSIDSQGETAAEKIIMENVIESVVEEVEVQEETLKKPKYLPRHLEPMDGWKPIKIGNFEATRRAGKGCIAAESALAMSLRPLKERIGSVTSS